MNPRVEPRLPLLQVDLVASVNGFCAELTLTSKVEKVALVSYASSVKVEEELTNDYSKINSKNQLISADFYGGATNIGGGIDSAISAVKNKGRPWANRVIVLMSDGIHNTGTNPITAAQNAVAAEIPIYTVSFSNEADIAVMQQIADMTGGDHYHAVNAQQLNDAFRNIARRLPSLLTE
jgi:Ca-activated chloride channel homolog